MSTTITSITTIQDNIYQGVDLLTINNPLSFIVEVEYSGTKPSRIGVAMSINGSVVDNYDAIPLKDTSASTRQFIFHANEYVKSYMPPYFDELITSGSATEVVPVQVSLEFAAGSVSKTINFRALDGASQFSFVNGACAIDVYNNNHSYWYSKKGGFCYIYFFTKPSEEGTFGVCEIEINGVTYEIGDIKEGRFYRVKIPTNWEGERAFTCTRTERPFEEGEVVFPYLFLTGTVYSFDPCNPKILKYYDRRGQYRFIPMGFAGRDNEYRTIGNVSKYVTSLVTDSSDSYVRAREKKQTLSLTLVNFPKDKIELIDDLLASPYVYLHNNSNLLSDELSDWLMVKVATNRLRIIERGGFLTTTIEVEMPKIYNITT